MSSSGGRVRSRSTSTVTRIENGRRVSRTETVVRHPDGRVERSVEEHEDDGSGGGGGGLQHHGFDGFGGGLLGMAGGHGGR